jgi:hypothetical protein
MRQPNRQVFRSNRRRFFPQAANKILLIPPLFLRLWIIGHKDMVQVTTWLIVFVQRSDGAASLTSGTARTIGHSRLTNERTATAGSGLIKIEPRHDRTSSVTRKREGCTGESALHTGESHSSAGESHSSAGESHSSAGETCSCTGETSSRTGESHSGSGEDNARTGESRFRMDKSRFRTHKSQFRTDKSRFCTRKAQPCTRKTVSRIRSHEARKGLAFVASGCAVSTYL